jgi:hypothetical protein
MNGMSAGGEGGGDPKGAASALSSIAPPAPPGLLGVAEGDVLAGGTPPLKPPRPPPAPPPLPSLPPMMRARAAGGASRRPRLSMTQRSSERGVVGAEAAAMVVVRTWRCVSGEVVRRVARREERGRVRDEELTRVLAQKPRLRTPVGKDRADEIHVAIRKGCGVCVLDKKKMEPRVTSVVAKRKKKCRIKTKNTKDAIFCRSISHTSSS